LERWRCQGGAGRARHCAHNGSAVDRRCVDPKHRRARRASPRQGDRQPPGQAQIAGLTKGGGTTPMTILIEHFMAPEVRLFAIAAMMVLVIGLTEGLTMLIGFSLSELVGKAIDFDGESEHGFVNAVSWLNVGGVPLLIFILLILGLFSMAGF